MEIWKRLLVGIDDAFRVSVAMIVFCGWSLVCIRADEPLEHIDFSKAMFSKLTDEQKRLLSEYHESYPRLVDFYNNCTMEVTQESYSLFRPSDPPGLPAPPNEELEDGLRSLVRYVYYGNGGDYYRLDREETDLQEQSKLRSSYVGIVTPSDSYILQHEDRGGYFIEEHNTVSEGYMARLWSYHFANAPYAFDGQPLKYIVFKKPAFAGDVKDYFIDDIASATVDGERVVTISISFTTERGGGSITLRLLPDLAWALRELATTSKAPVDLEGGTLGYRSTRCSYERDAQGMPNLLELVMETGRLKPEDGSVRLVTRDKYSVESFTSGAADMSDFDVTRLVGDSGR